MNTSTMNKVNHSEAAKMLGIDRRTLTKLIKQHSISCQTVANQKRYKLEDIKELHAIYHREPERDLKVIMIGSAKGGTGKTTTVKYLSRILTSMGKKVLVIDGDPQHYYTDFAYNYLDDDTQDLKDMDLLSLLLEKRKNVVLSPNDGIDFISGNRLLEHYERELGREMGYELKLKAVIASLLPKYDYILIDTSPSQGGITGAALVASNVLIIPIIPDIDSLEAGKDVLKRVQKALNSPLADKFKLFKIFILPVKSKRGWSRSLSKDILNEINSSFSEIDLELDGIEVNILPAISEYPQMPTENYEGIIKDDTRPWKDYEIVVQEVFNVRN